MDFLWLLRCMIATFYINSLLTNMCVERLKPLHRLVVFLCCTLIAFLFPQSIGVWMNIISFLIVYLFIIYLQKHPFLNAIGISLNYTLGVLINYLILAALYLARLDWDFLNGNMLYFFIFNVSQVCIMHPITYAAGQLYRKLIRLKILPLCKDKVKRKILSLMSMAILLCGFVFVFNVIFGNYIGYTLPILLFNSILFLLFFFSTGTLLFFLYRAILENYEFQARVSKADSLSDYACRLERLYQEIRGFKHDYMNILSSMYSYLDEGRINELKQYFEKNLLPDGRKLASEDDLIGKLSNLKIMELKGLLYTKMQKAEDSLLKIVIDIPDTITEMNIGIPDLVRILGIFLDNALEAAIQTPEKELYIGILLHEKCNYLHITNSSPPIPNLTELFQEGYSIKEGHYGIGLYEVENLLKKYPKCLLNTEYKDGKFTQILQIKNE